MPTRRTLRGAIAKLRAAGVASPQVDAQILAAHFTGISRSEVIRRDLLGQLELGPAFWAGLERRAKREPLQHITGVAYFLDLEIDVGPGVFIPRPETETLVQIALELMDQACPVAAGTTDAQNLHHHRPCILELCLGSGAISIGLARALPESRIVGVELSEVALSWALRNVTKYHLQDHIAVRGGDVRNFRDEKLKGSIDLLVANPPYVPGTEIPEDTEVATFDPSLALYGGGAEGLEIPRAIVEAADYYLRSGGWLVMEHAQQQGPATRRMAENLGSMTHVQTRQDLTGKDRFLCAQKL